ncbi:hypothetical protein Tco_1303883 [Tanacetum coccineum]
MLCQEKNMKGFSCVIRKKKFENICLLPIKIVNFARFNTIITSLKALDEGYSSKNYVRKFLRALHPKWRAKVTAIEESKDLTSLSLDELIRNLKVHEMIIKKDSEFVKQLSSSREEVISLRQHENNKKKLKEVETNKNDKSDRNVLDAVISNHLLGMSKTPKDKNKGAFIGGSWSDNSEEDDEKTKDETCLIAQAFNEDAIDNGYSQSSKAYIILNKYAMKIKESLNVTFYETPPPSKTSPLVDDDIDKEESIKVTEKKNLEDDIEDETLEIDEVVNIKESKNQLS